MPVHSESLKPMTNSSSAIERRSASSRRPRRGGATALIRERAFGFAWPAASRAAASLSRIT